MKKKSIIKYSIRTKLTCITIMVICSLILLFWAANRMFLPEYYENTKIETLVTTYEYINEEFSQYDSGKVLDENVNSSIERICSVSNVNVYVYDFNSNIINIKEKTGVNYVYPEYITKLDRDNSFDKLMKYIPNDIKIVNYIPVDKKPDTKIETLKVNNQYSVSKVYNSRINSYEIELCGRLSNGLYVYVSSNFDSIQESSAITNKFLAYIGIGIIAVGFVVMMFVSRSFSRPILDLANIAKRMSKLDFEAKYEVKTQDEIGQLGENMNFLSDTLQKTIGELKNANLELEKDIQNKIQTDEMRKEFLSNVSHELKTPIAIIQGYAEGLKDNVNEDQESRDYYIDVIIDEAQKMNNMVKKLLDLNHIEFGDSPLNIERFDIMEIIRATLSATEILAKQKNVKIILRCPEKLFVWADEYMLEEVLNNYLSNAYNHVDTNGVIDISISCFESVARIYVYNSGSSIPKDELEKVWLKFYKVDKARTREYGGSGVGLSIVKAIMDSHNKKYGVENYKSGVRFWFEVDVKSIE